MFRTARVRGAAKEVEPTVKPAHASREIAAGTAERTLALWGPLAALSLSMLMSSLGTSIVNVALPTLAQAFGAAFQAVQWVVLAYLLAITTLIVSVGRLGDITGRRRLLLAGILLFTAASVACGMAPTLGLLIAARAAQGLGAAIMMALTMALVAGWRTVFLVNVPLGLLALLLAHRYLPLDRSQAKSASGGFDMLGTLLLASTLAAYALAMTLGRGSFGPLNLALLLAAVLGLGLLVLAEARAASPLIQLALFRDPVQVAGLATSALVSTVMMATQVVGPFYLGRGLGLDAAQVGLVLSVGPVAAALTGVPAGRIADRLGAPRMTSVGLFALGAGCIVLSLLPATHGVIGYIAPSVVMTVGYALFQTANNTAVMTSISPDRRGVMSGLLNLSRNLGLISGASVMGAVFAFGSATTNVMGASPEAIAAGLQLTFAVAAVVITAALVIASASHVLARRAQRQNASRISSKAWRASVLASPPENAAAGR
jgi:MFS family permease